MDGCSHAPLRELGFETRTDKKGVIAVRIGRNEFWQPGLANVNISEPCQQKHWPKKASIWGFQL
jgi:hypothetical protein